MGLLDEAIREHLELKRKRGADPGEIARAERSALTPVFTEDGDHAEAPEGAPEQASQGFDESPREEPPPADFGWEDVAASAPEGDHAAPAAAQRAAAPARQEPPAHAASHVDLPTEAHATIEPDVAPMATTGQETAELDMSTVLEAGGAELAAEMAGEPVQEGPPGPVPGRPAEPARATAPAAAQESTAQPVAAPQAAAPAAAPAGRKWAGWRRGSREERDPEEQVAEARIPEEIPGQERLHFE